MSAKNIRFASEEHRDFFLSMMSKSRHDDSYPRSFFYVMGIAPETRANICSTPRCWKISGLAG